MRGMTHMKSPLSSAPPVSLSSPAASTQSQQQISESCHHHAILNLGPDDISLPLPRPPSHDNAHNARQCSVTMAASDPSSAPQDTMADDVGSNYGILPNNDHSLSSTQARGAQLLDEFQKMMGEPSRSQQTLHLGPRTMHTSSLSAASADPAVLSSEQKSLPQVSRKQQPRMQPSSPPHSAPLLSTAGVKSPPQSYQSMFPQDGRQPQVPSFSYHTIEAPSSGYPATAGGPPPPFSHRARPSQISSINGNLSRANSGENYSTDPFDLADTAAGEMRPDERYPSPSLYDITLSLSADAGLDAWWSNVAHVLQNHYGADRATLAVPGDVTDLENVPWGQKATFQQYESDLTPVSPKTDPDAARRYAKSSGGPDFGDFPARPDDGRTSFTGTATDSTSAKRPKLMGRHTFAGHSQHGDYSVRETENSLRGTQRRRRSSFGTTTEKQRRSMRATRLSSDPSHQTTSPTPSDPPSPTGVHNGEASPTNSSVVVFPVPRALEVEPDPLIKRTGVVKLFGQTKPTVLTRNYVSDPLSSPSGASYQSRAMTQPTPTPEAEQVPEFTQGKRGASHSRTSSVPQQSGASRSAMAAERSFHQISEHRSQDFLSGSESYEEHEQPSPGRFAESPPLATGPRRNSDGNPFFRHAGLAEEASCPSGQTSSYDHPDKHKQSRPNEPNSSRTVVHIPLLHSPKSKKSSSDTLRFPVAVVSFTSPIVPYPSNWRRSLTYLLPHLTTSYGLAQQYSQLEKLLATSSTSRFGHILGLGGTFSDESSELELVAGLSGHVNYPLGEENAFAGAPPLPLSSPSTASGITRSSSVRSKAGILSSEIPNIGTRKDTLPTPGSLTRRGSDTVDSPSKLKQSAIGNAHQKCSVPAKGSSEDSPSISRKHNQEAFDELTSRDPGLVPTPSAMESPAGNPMSPTQLQQQQQQQPQPQPQPQPQNSSRQSSGASNVAAAQQPREPPGRPVPDTIAQLMLNSVPLHLFLAKPQTGELIWTNSKFDAYRKSHPQGPRVRDPWQNVHESEREILQTEWARALKTGSQITERVRVKRFSDEGAYRWFIFRANPLLSGAGELLYWIGSFLDVHEQHVSEMKAAREREVFATDAKYRALANSIPQIVFEAAEFRGLIFANEQWQLYTGQGLDEAQNFGFAKYIHRDDLEKCGIMSPPLIIPEDVGVPEYSNIVTNSTNVLELPQRPPRDADASSPDSTPVPRSEGPLNKGQSSFSFGVTPALRELVDSGVVTMQRDENGRDSYATEIRFRSRGGEFRWHLVRLVKVDNPFGNGEASWYGTCTDINDRKILERELNSAMHKLNTEMESKTNFFSNMSHELRTPLTGILGTIPFILETHLDNDQRRMLDTIQNSSTNLRELVDNILDVSRVEAGKVNIVHQWFHVRSMLEDVMDTIGSRAIDKGLELNYLVDVDVPAMINGDRLRIRQVLINLVGNAVKFTSHGEIYCRCSIRQDPNVSLADSELLLNFDVVDTGKGFSSKDAQRLMQRFSQIEANGSQQHAGSGLGLFLSKQLVEMHGGRLTPTSKEGRGAKFSFFVRVDADAPSSPPSQPQPQPQPQPRPSSAAKKKLNTAGLPALRPGERINLDGAGMTAHDIVESPSQDCPVKSSLAIPEHSSRSDSSFASVASSALSPDLAATSFSSTSESSPQQQYQQQQQQPDEHTATEQQEIQPSAEVVQAEQKVSENADTPRQAPLAAYSVLIICPFDYAREAIQQHIEQVIPLEVTAKVTTILDLEDWKELVNSGGCTLLTHVVICWPDSNDVLEIMEHVLRPCADCSPTLVVVADMYLKRQICRRYEEAMKTDTKVSIVPKPVKPSAFATIFDPANKRDLSKDRNKDTARELNNSFKTMTKIVKEVIGNKGYRVLLVEDDETNRTVMLKYLEKVKLASETAANGQQCVDMVFSKEPGYYSLIICDIQMPVKNGYETCQEIRSWEQRNHFPEIPIMALSANAMMDQIDDAARAGFNDYVTKPIKHNELGKMIMELLDPSSPRVVLKDRNRKG